MTEPTITGSEGLAYGALEAGVQFVTGYPGSPATATVDALLRLAPDGVQIEWGINEKSAFDAAFGASLAGTRALVCLKSVGLNVALDSLMVSNLAPGDGGFVALTGDDPGGWGSQNEEDSRPLVAAAEVPLLEPETPSQARELMRLAFDLSETHRLPVLVRITRALALDSDPMGAPLVCATKQPRPLFQRQPERFNVLPIKVVDFHHELQARMEEVQAQFEHSPANSEEGTGLKGIVCAGQVGRKLDEALAQSGQPEVRILRLRTLNPLPVGRIATFLRRVEAAVVLEETAPYLETQVQAIAQRAGLALPIYGRSSGHVPTAGELGAAHIVLALTSILPGQSWPAIESVARTMPSRRSLCDGCPYIPAFDTLVAIMEGHGGRDAFVVTGETGCMVRAQLPPWQMMDVKYGMGSSIGLAAGLGRAGIPQRVVALTGDSAFLHSGLGELIDARRTNLTLLVVLLENSTTALSGGQPHPASGQSTQALTQKAVDLAALARACGVEWVKVVDPMDGPATENAFERGLGRDGVSVVIVRSPCPEYA